MRQRVVGGASLHGESFNGRALRPSNSTSTMKFFRATTSLRQGNGPLTAPQSRHVHARTRPRRSTSRRGCGKEDPQRIDPGANVLGRSDPPVVGPPEELHRLKVEVSTGLSAPPLRIPV